MDRRLELHEMLVSALGSSNVYFQPPTGLQIKYPCIVYTRERIEDTHADNESYRRKKKYSVTVIDRDPESEVPDRIADIRYCSHDRRFVNDNLYHDVFTLYY